MAHVKAVSSEKKAVSASPEELISVLRDTVVSLVRRDGPDLSSRQLAVFLTCYLREDGLTVRGLASELNVSKPAITRALDRLGDLDLTRRMVDPLDRRSVLVKRTIKGSAYLKEILSIMGEATEGKKSSEKTKSGIRRAA